MNASPTVREVRCPVCDGPDLTGCIRIPQVPVYCNLLHASREAALNAAKGDIDLRFCHGCGHLFNAAFEPGRVDYSSEYENSLHFSGRFREYAQTLAEHLVERHGLRDKTVIEIACGQGDFLGSMCSLGGNRGLGFDPSHAPGRSDASAGADVTFIQDYYSEAYAGHTADLICCRHALEHIDRPGDFLNGVRRAIGEHPTPVFFEVPNALFTLRDLGIWDIIYEHCGYFSEDSLHEAFRRSGFAVDQVETGFGGQFLALHASPGGEKSADRREPSPDLARLVHRFADHYRAKVEGWGEILRRQSGDGSRVVLWGAGSKGVSFVNALSATDQIGYLIDLNPYKVGRFVPVTGHQVRAPAFLVDYRPDAVVVMNPLYRDEIGRDLRAMGLSPEMLVDESQ